MRKNGSSTRHTFQFFKIHTLFNICNNINPISSRQTPFHLLGTSFAYPLSVSLAESAPKTLTVFWYCLEFHRVSHPFPYFFIVLAGRSDPDPYDGSCPGCCRIIAGCRQKGFDFRLLCRGFPLILSRVFRISVCHVLLPLGLHIFCPRPGIKCVFICLLSLSLRKHPHRHRHHPRFVWQFSAWHSRF